MDTGKMNARRRRVGALTRLCDIVTASGDSEHSPPRRLETTVALARTRVEELHAF
jgi:hypothetical protein